ncbi:MAG: glycerophosphodiester phosphodiesterase [Acidimicrobiales bacterium]
MATRWPFLDWPTPIALAHRGGAAEHPENTMVGFEAAVRLGYQYLETDVHATADGVLVAFHDDDLSPVSDRAGLISALPYAEVRRARVGGEPIPLLADVLGTWPNIRVNLDAKHDHCVDGLVEAVGSAGAWDRVCLGSFSGRRVRRLRQLAAGRACTWMGPSEIGRLRLATWLRRLPGDFAPAAQVPPGWGRYRLVDRTFVAGAHARGIAVHVWTINDRNEMEALLDLGVDGIFTDRPTLLKEVLTRRGQWTERLRE